MFDIDKWQEIWHTITRNKTRSFFTAFGVFWGILMLTLLLGAGNGLEMGMKKEIRGLATNSCFFFANQTSKPYKGFKKGRSWSMRNADIEAIQNGVPSVKYLSPMIFGGGGNNNLVRGDKSGSFSVRGCFPNYVNIEEQNILYGRYINDVDITDVRKVCYIGKNVYEKLFEKGENPIGKIIRCNGIYYKVIGVGTGLSNVQIGGRSEDMVVLPITTMQRAYNRGDVFDFLAATTKDGYDVSLMEEEIKTIVRSQNSIAPDDDRALDSFNISKQFQIFNNLFLGIRILIWIVGVGTLLAGAIGVSNIMLVSVKERTKEIGVRRALGAKPRNIISQIMNESLVLTAMAGFIGLSVGVGILALIEFLISHSNVEDEIFISQIVIRFDVALSASFILILMGLLAGMLPAWRAMQIKPIEALSEE